MSDRWFFGRADRANSRYGPFSASELRQFALAGELQPTDTVWKEGIAAGVVATRVKNLFAVTVAFGPAPVTPIAAAMPTPAATEPAPGPISEESLPAEPKAAGEASDKSESLLSPSAERPAPEAAASAEEAPVTATSSRPDLGSTRPAPKKVKAEVQTITGGILLSQDGKSVQYRKKCRKCGFQDTSRSSQVIRNGVVRQTFFCPKCRKPSEVEIRGRA